MLGIEKANLSDDPGDDYIQLALGCDEVNLS